MTAIETLMAVTLRFAVIKNSVIASPRAIVPAADPPNWVVSMTLPRGIFT